MSEPAIVPVDANSRVQPSVFTFFGTGTPAERPKPVRDIIDHHFARDRLRPVTGVAPTAPEALPPAGRAINRARAMARLASEGKPCPPDRRMRIDLLATRDDADGDAAYWRTIDQIAADIRANGKGRVAHARAVLDSLRDPNAEDGRGEIAAGVYQRIEPASVHTPENERAGRLSEEERQQLGVKPAEQPEAAKPGVGGPTWSRALSSFNNTSITVELPSGATDYFSYKPYRFATARTIETIKRIGERHHQATGMLLRVGDIAARGGGRIPDHASHRTGNIFDLDIVFNDGRTTAEPDRDSVNASWRSPAYDRDLTRKLIRIIKAVRPEAQILFNDPVLIREGLTTHYPNHDNHMHVQRLS